MSDEPYTGNDFYCDRVLNGRTPVDVVAETENVLAFHHTRPFWPVHIVVIPKRHIPSLVDLGSSLLRLATDGRRVVSHPTVDQSESVRDPPADPFHEPVLHDEGTHAGCLEVERF